MAPESDRSRSAIALGVVLFLIALLFLAYAGVILASYLAVSGDVGGIASLVELLMQAPTQVLVPSAIGIAAGIAGIGVLRARRWGAVLAIGVGLALILGGVVLLWVVFSELGLPGSFAVLFLPPAAVALVVGTFVLWAARATEAHLR